MATGIRAEVKVDGPTECPVVRAAAAADSPGHSVSRSGTPSEDGGVIEEFVLESDESVDCEELRPVFSYGTSTAYRFTREPDALCPCAYVERFEVPVVDVRVHEGAMYLTFHAPEMGALQEIVGGLRERYPSLDVQRLLHTRGEKGEQDLVFVDRSVLTDRQLEVLETAHRLGYFEHPKGSNATEVAEELGIATSTFTEHLSAAQRKLLDSILNS